jgi:hypothetical protein
MKIPAISRHPGVSSGSEQPLPWRARGTGPHRSSSPRRSRSTWRVDTVTINLVSFWISKEEGVDGHEFVEAFCGVITDISQNSCVDKRDG